MINIWNWFIDLLIYEIISNFKKIRLVKWNGLLMRRRNKRRRGERNNRNKRKEWRDSPFLVINEKNAIWIQVNDIYSWDRVQVQISSVVDAHVAASSSRDLFLVVVYTQLVISNWMPFLSYPIFLPFQLFFLHLWLSWLIPSITESNINTNITNWNHFKAI